MDIEKDNLPDDPELLKKMLTDLAVKYESLDEKYIYLDEKYKTLQRMLFGKKSEKLTEEDENQMRFFNEAEEGAAAPDDPGENSPGETASKTTEVKSYTRTKGGRKPLPEHLHREEIIHDLTDDESACPCCGDDRPVIGEESTEELDIIPPKILVNKHIRKKYGPCSCNDFLEEEIPEIKTAAMPPRLIPQSIVSSGLAAYIVTAKFCDGLPFYRQSKIFTRLDIDISRATLCNWAMAVAEKCSPLVDLMTEEIRSGPLIRMDETTLQVLKEPGRPAESKSYMWVAMGYTAEEKPLILYRYHPTRSGNVPKEFLEGYEGWLQTDGYGGYNRAVEGRNINHVGCFAHARRYFEKAWKLNKKSKVGYKGLDYIKKIYAVENELRGENLKPEIFTEKRKKAVIPILDAFYNWLETQKDSVVPKSKAGEAIRYTLSEWNKLIRYLDHHLLTPDNNLIENVIRPFVIGRKNWLFSNTPRGAEASATLYSLIETAKANGLEPYKYLRYLFDHLPAANTKAELRTLLPGRLS
ncbi:MAG: IS66 family transposase [Lentisphaerae bacterium]|nr:IS66 family transposase [Lentisphaerota bacterium]